MWKNRRVLVTGATGLLGSHLVEHLLKEGADVVCIIRDNTPKARFYCLPFIVDSKFEAVMVHGDVEDFNLVSRTMNEYQIQTTFHLAAQTQVGIANLYPIPTLKTNIMGTINVLESFRLMSNYREEELIIASSDKAYGDVPYWKLPYKEEEALNGKHPYDVSKSCVDLIAQAYGETYNLPIGITRCGNLFGEGDLNWNRLIPGTIKSLLNDEQPVIRSDGKMVRDYFYVKDAVKAYIMLAEYIHESQYANVFNFSYSGYDEPKSVIQIVELIAKLMSKDIQPKILDQASNEIKEQYLDSKKALEILKWKPSFTLEEGLSNTIKWYMRNIK